MNSRQWGVNAYASLKGFAGLLAVTVLFLALGSDAFAQNDPYAWPYFGPDPEVKSFLNAAFMAQAGIMGAFAQTSGASGGSSTAMQVIGALCALVGGIVLAFNRKAWTPSVVLGWLTVVIIIVFVPINMRLLFAPVPKDDSSNIGLGILNSYRAAAMNKENFGFAPQMAAVDVASRLQVIVSDMFRSNGWRDITSEMMANERLLGDDNLNAGKTWLQQLEEYKDKGCGGIPLNAVMGDAQANSANASLNTASAPLQIINTFGDVWQGIESQFTRDKVNDEIPPIVVLYDERQESKLPRNFDKVAYANGIQNIYDEVVDDGKKIVWKSSNNTDGVQPQQNGAFQVPEDASLSVQDALTALNDKEFFDYQLVRQQVGTSYEYGPGYFIQPFDNVYSAEGASDTENNSSAKVNPDIAQTRCFYRDARFTIGEGESKVDAGGLECPDTSAEARSSVLSIMASMNNRSTSGLSPYWEAFMKASATPALMAMPVPEALVIKSTSVDGKGNEGAQELANKDNSCIGLGRDLITSAFTRTLQDSTEKKNGHVFDPIVKTLTTRGEPLPSAKDGFTIKQISSVGLTPEEKAKGSKGIGIDGILTLEIKNSGAAARQRTAENLQIVLNSRLRDAYNFAAQTEGFKNLPQASSPESAAATNQNIEEIVRLILLEKVVGAIHFVTLQQNIKQTGEEVGAQADGTEARIVGYSDLTSLGGSIAYYFGLAGTNVLAFFTGAMAQAFVYFLQMFIQLTILCLIVLTPFLFLGGALMPRAAPGVLIISVVVAFIMQFVPVTWIILNYMGGLIYEIIAAINPRGAYTLQSMLIIVMSTLYMGVVSLTLYLMFKLGDPSAMIGRLGALDGAANKMANTATDIVKGLAITAATLLGAGGLGAALGVAGRYFGGSVGGAAAQAAASKVAGSKETGTTPQVPPQAPEENGQPNGLQPGGGEGAVATLTPEQQAVQNEAMQAEADAALGTFAASNENLAKHFVQIAGGERDIGPTSDGRRILASIDSNGNLKATVNPPLSVSNLSSGMMGTQKAAAATAGGEAPDSVEGEQGDTEGDNAEDKKTIEAVASAKDGTQPVEVVAKPEAPAGSGGPGVPYNTGFQPGMKTPGPALAPETGSGGSGQAPAATGSANPNTNPPETQSEAPDNSTQTYAQMLESQQSELKKSADFVQNRNTETAARRAVKNAEREAWIKSRKKKKGESLTEDEKAYLKENFDDPLEKLAAIDTTAIDSGTLINSLSDWDAKHGKLQDLRLGADVKPGLGKVAFSGFIGGFQALGGGVGSIPFVGKILSGATNEWYEAEERAKAWQSAGGFMKHWKTGGDAKRMKFYQQHTAPLGAGYQYQQMDSVGAFQVMPDSAKFQVAQSVAKMRSEYEALISKGLQNGKFDIDKLRMNDADLSVSSLELQGLGRVQSASAIGSVWGEASAMQGESWRVQVINDKGELEKVSVKPNATALARIYSDLGIKQAGKYFDAAMTDWYGIVEKQYERGKPEWDVTRNMGRDRAAAAKFILEDISDDYLAGAHLKMVEGKQSYYGYVGKYQEFLNLRNKENTVLYETILNPQNEAKIKAHLVANASKVGMSAGQIASMSLTPADMKKVSNAMYSELSKAATGIVGKAQLPLSAIFEEAMSSGKFSVLQKSMLAASNIDALASDLFGRTMTNYSEYFDNNLAINPSIKQPGRIENKGFRQDIGKGIDIFNKKIIVGQGGDIAKGARAIEQTMQVIKELTKSLSVDDAKKFQKEAIITHKEAKGNARYIGHLVEDNVYKAMQGAGVKIEVHGTKMIEGKLYQILSDASLDEKGKGEIRE